MEYKKSSIFSDKQKIDNRNLCLYLNFKNEKNENILNLLKLIEKDLIEKFEDDFIFDMEFNVKATFFVVGKINFIEKRSYF